MRHIGLIAAVLVVSSVVGAQGIGPGGAIPAVANLPGMGGTFWQSDVVLHNPGETSISVRLLFYPEIRNGEPDFDPVISDPTTVPPFGQVKLSNIVQTEFGMIDTKGALIVNTDDGSSVVIGSRTYTHGDDGGSYGQEVFGVLAADRAWAAGAQHDGFYRTNVGIFLPVAPPNGQSVGFDVIVRDSDGDEVGSGSLFFSDAGLQQRPVSFTGVDQLFGGSVEVVCSDPSYFWYGYISRVDQISGDAVYRPLRGVGF